MNAKEDEKNDELVTRAAAMVIIRLKPALKAAIKDLVKECRQEAIAKVIESRWVRAVLGLLFVAGLIAAWIKESPGH